MKVYRKMLTQPHSIQKLILRSTDQNMSHVHTQEGHEVPQLFEPLRYKPEGGGFDYRLCHRNFLLT